MFNLDYPRGLTKIGDHTYAWLLPDGGWGWSNSGLVVGEGESLMFDTLFDLPLTREMLAGIAEVTADAPVKRLVISHGNGDHFYGNELMGDDVEIISTDATHTRMAHETPASLAALKELDTPAGRFVKEYFFGPFDLGGVTVRAADTIVGPETTFTVGGVEARMKDLGPAHTASDSILYVPEDGVVYGADLLFFGGTPIAWEGKLENWIAALDYMLELDAETYVPGHGPISNKEGVRHLRGYIQHMLDGANAAFDRGDDPIEAARNFDFGPYAGLQEKGRIVLNFLNTYRFRGRDLQMELSDIINEVAILEGFGDK